MLRASTFVLVAFAVLAASCGSGDSNGRSSSATTVRRATATGAPSARPTVAATTLQDAVAQGLAEVRFEGRGRFYGDAILFTIRRTVARDLTVVVPPGTVLRNSNAGEQDMVLGAGGPFEINDDVSHEYSLEAYCLEFHDAIPGRGGSLSLGVPDNPNVLRVLEAVDRVPGAAHNSDAIQGAVWAVTDDIAFGEARLNLSADNLRIGGLLLRAAGLDPFGYRLFRFLPPAFFTGSPTTFLAFNNVKPPFDDPKFRQALSLAVNKTALFDLALDRPVTPTDRILPPEAPGVDWDVVGLSYDAARARKLLSESRYADPASRPAVTIASSFGDDHKLATVVANMWRQELGVEAGLFVSDTSILMNNVANGDFGVVVLYNYPVDYADARDVLSDFFQTRAGRSAWGYANAELDGLLDQAALEQDARKRAALLAQAEQLVVSDAVILPLWVTYVAP